MEKNPYQDQALREEEKKENNNLKSFWRATRKKIIIHNEKKDGMKECEGGKKMRIIYPI